MEESIIRDVLKILVNVPLQGRDLILKITPKPKVEQ